MEIGYYNDPITKVKPVKKKPGTIAVVIAVYLGDMARTEYSANLNEKLENQGKWKEDKFASIKFTLDCHKRFKAGLKYDIILVDNGSTVKEATDYYKATGHKVLTRENEGFSFGAWKYAWETLKDKYDYYLFQEADYAPTKDNWLKEIMDEFLKDDKVGAIGNVLETRGIEPTGAPYEIMTKIPEEIIQIYLSKCLKKRRYMCNFDGCYTFTSSKILKQVDKNGGLKVFAGGFFVFSDYIACLGTKYKPKRRRISRVKSRT
jgi:cellulose synthase/poly-beta-1,6-N-acetylglucosamine synthase-like glycosyltransferase